MPKKAPGRPRKGEPGRPVYLSGESLQYLATLALPNEEPGQTLARLLELVAEPDKSAEHGIQYHLIAEAMASGPR